MSNMFVGRCMPASVKRRNLHNWQPSVELNMFKHTVWPVQKLIASATQGVSCDDGSRNWPVLNFDQVLQSMDQVL